MELRELIQKAKVVLYHARKEGNLDHEGKMALLRREMPQLKSRGDTARILELCHE